MASVRFTSHEIIELSYRIQNCLNNPRCRSILRRYLMESNSSVLFAALELWEVANNSTSWNEEAMFNLMDELDDFNQHHLLSISDFQQRIDYIKDECVRILERGN